MTEPAGDPGTRAGMLLWYEAPAAEWVEALPVGNGRLGAMVFGGVERAQIRARRDGGCKVRYGDEVVGFDTRAGGCYGLDAKLRHGELRHDELHHDELHHDERS